jgi:hypothetical protein
MTGSFYKPPCSTDKYAGVDPNIRAQYIQRSLALYTEFNMKTPRALMTKINSTYKSGLYEQISGRCETGDGPMAYFSLLSLFRPSAAAYRDELIEIFNQAHHHFAKGDPKMKIHFLRPRLIEVIDLQIQLNGSSTGRKIVGRLSLRSHYLSHALNKYGTGP